MGSLESGGGQRRQVPPREANENGQNLQRRNYDENPARANNHNISNNNTSTEITTDGGHQNRRSSQNARPPALVYRIHRGSASAAGGQRQCHRSGPSEAEEERFRICIILIASWLFLAVASIYMFSYVYLLEWNPEIADPILVFGLDLAVLMLYLMFLVDMLASIAVIVAYKDYSRPFRYRILWPAIGCLCLNHIHGALVWAWVWTGEFPRSCVQNTYYTGRRCPGMASLRLNNPEGMLALSNCKCDYGDCLPECRGLRLIQHYFWGTFWLFAVRTGVLVLYIPWIRDAICGCKWCCCIDPRDNPTVEPACNASMCGSTGTGTGGGYCNYDDDDCCCNHHRDPCGHSRKNRSRCSLNSLRQCQYPGAGSCCAEYQKDKLKKRCSFDCEENCWEPATAIVVNTAAVVDTHEIRCEAEMVDESVQKRPDTVEEEDVNKNSAEQNIQTPEVRNEETETKDSNKSILCDHKTTSVVPLPLPSIKDEDDELCQQYYKSNPLWTECEAKEKPAAAAAHQDCNEIVSNRCKEKDTGHIRCPDKRAPPPCPPRQAQEKKPPCPEHIATRCEEKKPPCPKHVPVKCDEKKPPCSEHMQTRCEEKSPCSEHVPVKCEEKKPPCPQHVPTKCEEKKKHPCPGRDLPNWGEMKLPDEVTKALAEKKPPCSKRISNGCGKRREQDSVSNDCVERKVVHEPHGTKCEGRKPPASAPAPLHTNCEDERDTKSSLQSTPGLVSQGTDP